MADACPGSGALTRYVVWEGHAHSVTARRGSRGADRAELDLPQLIQRYIRVFASTDPARAFQYILTITLVRSETAAVRSRAHGSSSNPLFACCLQADDARVGCGADTRPLRRR